MEPAVSVRQMVGDLADEYNAQPSAAGVKNGDWAAFEPVTHTFLGGHYET